MVKYLCRVCSYRFKTRGDLVPKTCPACGNKNNVIKNYDADAILREVSEEDLS